MRSTIENQIYLVALAVVVVGGCSSMSPTDHSLPPGAVPFTAPAVYRDWFADTEACSGFDGSIQTIEWYVVPNAATFPTAAGPKVGMWEKSGSTARIVVAGNFTDHEMVVRHEMLHHILDREGHPPEFFVHRCQLTWETWAAGHA